MATINGTKIASVIGVTVIVLLLDLLGVYYATSHGLNIASTMPTLGVLSLPVLWLPVIGVALV